MTIAGLVLRNALRNKRRFTLTLFSVGVSVFLLTGLYVVLKGLTNPASTDETALRIVVRHKVTLANMLFARYKPRLERMSGVKACTKLLWIAGSYNEGRSLFSKLACDHGAHFSIIV